MIGDLFDSPWKILIVAVVLIVLFGSKKLPVAARSLGRSMRILKSEVSGLHDDDDEAEQMAAATATVPPTAQPIAPQQIGGGRVRRRRQLPRTSPWARSRRSALQAQIDSLQQQIRELKT